jgi:hypothetical protein
MSVHLWVKTAVVLHAPGVLEFLLVGMAQVDGQHRILAEVLPGFGHVPLGPVSIEVEVLLGGGSCLVDTHATFSNS